MKRYTLLIALTCATVMSFGQVRQPAKHVPVQFENNGYQDLGPKATKGGGDVIWQTTFDWADPSSPRGWTLPEGWVIKDSSDMGNPWIWMKDTLKWVVGTSNKTLNPPSIFATKNDGFMAMPIQSYNERDGITTTVPADSYFQTPKIDCSAVSSVVVKFTQIFNLCCLSENVGNLQMLVTVDGGVHWATYDVQYNWGANNPTPARFQNPEINISDVAAGSPNVIIRFYFHNGNLWYYWMMDDLRLEEAYGNNLVLEDTWMDFDGGASATIDQIHYWPLSQMGMAGESSTIGANYMKGAILNSGYNDSENARLDVKVLKNGTQVFADASVPAPIWTLERDTAEIVNPYLATDYGDYNFVYTAVSDNSEEVAADNSTIMQFTVNDTMMHRGDFSAEASVNTSGWVNGNNSGDMMAVEYNLYKAAEVSSISAYIWSYSASATPQLQYALFKVVDEDKAEWISSEVIDMDSTRRGWVTLPMIKDGETEFLEPGRYYACAKLMGVGSCGIWLGRDLSTKFSGCDQYYSTTGWTGLAGAPLPMIGLNLNALAGPQQAPVTWNVNLNKHIASGEFIPGTDVVAVNGLAPSWSSSATMTDPDGDGIYSVTVEGLTINTLLKYKYSINGTQEANPATYRQYTVRYWNIIDSGYYNSGITTGIEDNSLVASFQVYPNPSQGAFTVAITNKVACDMVITLTDIQGHSVYQNVVKNSLSHQEVIDNQLAKGLYFLTINNGQEVKIQKVVIQ